MMPMLDLWPAYTQIHIDTHIHTHMWLWYFLCVCIHTNVNTCTQTKTSSTIPPLQLQPNIFPSRCCELRWPGFPSCFLPLTQNMRQFLCYVQVKSRIKCAFIFQTKDIDTTSPCPHTSNFFSFLSRKPILNPFTFLFTVTTLFLWNFLSLVWTAAIPNLLNFSFFPYLCITPSLQRSQSELLKLKSRHVNFPIQLPNDFSFGEQKILPVCRTWFLLQLHLISLFLLTVHQQSCPFFSPFFCRKALGSF